MLRYMNCPQYMLRYRDCQQYITWEYCGHSQCNKREQTLSCGQYSHVPPVPLPLQYCSPTLTPGRICFLQNISMEAVADTYVLLVLTDLLERSAKRPTAVRRRPPYTPFNKSGPKDYSMSTAACRNADPSSLVNGLTIADV